MTGAFSVDNIASSQLQAIDAHYVDEFRPSILPISWFHQLHGTRGRDSNRTQVCFAPLLLLDDHRLQDRHQNLFYAHLPKQDLLFPCLGFISPEQPSPVVRTTPSRNVPNDIQGVTFAASGQEVQQCIVSTCPSKDVSFKHSSVCSTWWNCNSQNVSHGHILILDIGSMKAFEVFMHLHRAALTYSILVRTMITCEHRLNSNGISVYELGVH